jgi:ketosteroid isomerase-like protein
MLQLRRIDYDKDHNVAPAPAGSGACALTGAVSLPGAASAHAGIGLDAAKEQVIRKWYAAWEQKDWGPVDALLADNFTFSSAAGDDHISKSAFKTQCWETQINFIDRFELERVIGNGNDAFVKYLCRPRTVNRSGTWNISGSQTKRWRPSSVISVRNPAFRLQ